MIRSSKKTSARKRLMSECGSLMRKLVLHRDGYKCCRCGKTQVLQAAHILSKGHYQRIRFELLNLLTLDVGCHIFGAHRDPTEFTLWVEQTYPGRIEQLRIMAATAPKLDLKELVIALRWEVEHLDPPSRAVVPDLDCAKDLPF